MKTLVQARPRSCSWEGLYFVLWLKPYPIFLLSGGKRLLMTQAEAGSIMGECEEAG